MAFTVKVASDPSMQAPGKAGRSMAVKSSAAKSIKSVKDPFRKDSGGKLSKTGATTRSESLARLRGKGALA